MKAMKSILILGLLASAAQAEIPETFARLWSDAAVTGRFERDIEKYRKGEAILEVVDQDGKPLPGAVVEVQHERHEFLFGCNLFVLDQLATPELNRKYEAAFARLFNSATLPFYWRELEPEPGKPRFAEDSPSIWRRPPPDRLVKWCKAHGITPKGHALMYVKSKFMPDWTARDDGEALRRQGAKHMAEIAERYQRDIPIWDAVNEELSRRYDFTGQWPVVPPEFLPWCFQEADRLFPKNTRLLINEGALHAHYMTSAYAAQVHSLLVRGIRLGGIGIQFHASRDDILRGDLYTPGRLAAVYKSLSQFHRPLYITEITINGTGENGPALQAAVVESLYRLWFSTPAMAGVTWWNLGDGTAYGTENKSLGGLLDSHMNPKPAYQALDKLVNHDWKTRLTLKTDANGKAGFRGFHGKYRLRISGHGATRTLPFELRSGSAPSRATLKVD